MSTVYVVIGSLHGVRISDFDEFDQNNKRQYNYLLLKQQANRSAVVRQL